MTHKQTFEEWMLAVDYELEKLCGMSSDMIDDFCYYDYYTDDVAVDTTAWEALQNACESLGFDINNVVQQ